jgi:H+-transporting ATPase
MNTSTMADVHPPNSSDLSTSTVSQLWQQLGSSPAGLTAEEVQRRLTQYGYNELAEEEVNPLLKFLSYLWGPIPWMIEIAAILSLVVHHWADFWIIVTLLVVNAIVGFWEEYQAGNAIAALKKQLALRAKVKRNGAWSTIAARELVPGDVIRLRIGDIVPADAKLMDGDPIEVDQSALTGESLPVTRKPEETVYSGSIVRQGEIDGVVYGTGQNTYFGKTAQLVQEAHSVSHFQKAVLKIGDFLIVVAVAMVVLILTVALFRGDPMMETFQFALGWMVEHEHFAFDVRSEADKQLVTILPNLPNRAVAHLCAVRLRQQELHLAPPSDANNRNAASLRTLTILAHRQ